MGTKFIIKSLGCKQNQLEGQIIRATLLKANYIEVEDIKEADIYILNSCTVTSHSDSQAHYLINHAKNLNCKIKTILTGCVAQTIKEHKNFDHSNVDLILGNSEKMNILKHLDKLNESFIDKTEVKDIFDIKTFENYFLENPNSTRISVKIQDGCNNRCSYCIIPYARGNSRSNSIENVIKQIEILENKNIKEIVLTGIHIGQWGLEWNLTLIDLLKEIEKTKIPRYRLGSLYVNELNDEIIDFLSKSEKFCPHFHLSLQSMDNEVLKSMNRKYKTTEEFKVIEKINKSFENPFIGCDIIVGFPNETEEQFENTYNNLKKAQLSQIHCFPYSIRENTPAAKMKQVPDYIKRKRCDKIIELSKELHKNFLEKNKNTIQEILIERKSPKTGKYSAITRNYIKIHFEDDNENLRHTLKTVNLKDYILE